MEPCLGKMEKKSGWAALAERAPLIRHKTVHWVSGILLALLLVIGLLFARKLYGL